MINYKNILRLLVFTYLTGGCYVYAEEKIDFSTSTKSILIIPPFPTVFTQKESSITPIENNSTIKDVIPPNSITDVTIVDKTYNSISLTWTAPGDDEKLGTATSYDIRYALIPITEENWDDAIQVKKELTPKRTGNFESFTISNLSPQTTYYFAIRTGDEVPNWSKLSKVVTETTLTAEETDIPQTTKFIFGREYSTSEGKFTDSFMLIGLKTYNKLNERLSLLTNFQLSSTVAPYQRQLSVQKSLEYNVTLLAELYRFQIFNKASFNGERHGVSLGLLLKGGGVKVDNSSSNILVKTCYGFRFLSVGKKFNGGYLDIGIGRSENFVDKGDTRLKIEGFLPLYKTKFKNTIFIAWLIDSDGLDNNKDELKFTVGTSINITKIFNLIDFLSPERETGDSD